MSAKGQTKIDRSTMPTIECTASTVVNKSASVILQIIRAETPQMNETADEAAHRLTARLTREPAVFDSSLRSKAARREQLAWLESATRKSSSGPVDAWQYTHRCRIEERLVARRETADSAAKRYGLVLEFEVPAHTPACNDGVLLRVEHAVTPLPDGKAQYERRNTVLIVRGLDPDAARRIGQEEVRQQVMWFKDVLEKGKVPAPYTPSKPRV